MPSPRKDNNIKIKTIDDCFKKYENIFILNHYKYCDRCHNFSDISFKNEIYLAPNILILIINSNDEDYDLDFPMKLNISKYINNPNSPKIYNLIGIISRINSHFIAYCHHFDDNWYSFNNQIVIRITKDKIKKITPYILFYQNSEIK